MTGAGPGLHSIQGHKGRELTLPGTVLPRRSWREEKSFETLRPYPTQTIPDSTLPPGQRVVQRAGKPGQVRLLVRLICENGQEAAREKVAEETLPPPVTEEVRVGPGR